MTADKKSKKFVISGRQTLSGEYSVQGNKNAALPLISGALLTRSVVNLQNVPQIADVKNLLELLGAIGVEVRWQNGTLSLDSRGFHADELPAQLVEKLRGSILLLGVLAPQVDRFRSALPGGCPIGRRSFEIHWDVFRSAGFTVTESAGKVELRHSTRVETPRVYLGESSVTATENALILFSALGKGIIQNPAREPHVFTLVDFLRSLGCEIELHPLYYRIHRGVSKSSENMTFQVPGDYMDAGTVAIAAAITDGEVVLRGISSDDFTPIRNVFEQFGLRFEALGSDRLKVSGGDLSNPSKVTSGLWPSFPTDLVSLAIVMATQGRGLCLLHDWMYENRMFFIDKIVRMGAQVTMCDPHRVLVEGPTRLRGTNLESPDIRAGMALVVAGLCAEGETRIEHADVIERGYENVVSRLASIGAEISEEVENE